MTQPPIKLPSIGQLVRVEEIIVQNDTPPTRRELDTKTKRTVYEAVSASNHGWQRMYYTWPLFDRQFILYFTDDTRITLWIGSNWMALGGDGINRIKGLEDLPPDMTQFLSHSSSN